MAAAKDSMDNSIVKDFKKLRVLAPYDIQMEDLVHDLTAALEESTKAPKNKDQRPSSSKQKVKRKSKKRKSCAVAINAGNISEASESSLDEALKDYMENVANQSDSDDILRFAKLQEFLNFTSHSISVAESDSFTENFSPMRPSRRRRRFKRMAVDAQPDSEVSITDYLREQRMKRLTTVRPKMKGQPQDYQFCDVNPMHMDSESTLERKDNKSRPVAETSEMACSSDSMVGKRKRGMKAGNSLDMLDDDSGQSNSKVEFNMESTSSSLSSESDFLFTNDEGQDGDDEHSDFFYEVGPACGIAGVIPWWETDTQHNRASSGDTNFEALLKGSFEHMSEDAKCNFKARLNVLARPGREIRMGRRRLPHRKPLYSLAKFIQDKQQWFDSPRLHSSSQSALAASSVQHSHSNGSQAGETKRRRKTPPTTPTAEIVGADADPIPESNIGNKLLQSMGWSPGTGLGADGTGMTTPVFAVKRSGRKGLGHEGTSCNTNVS